MTTNSAEELGAERRAASGRRSQQQRSIDTRRNILEAALRVFADRGFDGASTRAISELAEVPQPLLSYHFKTKDVLWRAAATWIFDIIEEDWRNRVQSPAGQDPVENVRLEFKRLFRSTLQRPHFYRFILRERGSDTPRRRWFIEQHFLPLMDRVLPSIAAAQAVDALPPGDPVLLYCMLVSLSSSLASFPEISARNGGAIDQATEEAWWALVERVMFKHV